MNKVLITGATGALGSALIAEFLRDSETVVTALLRADGASKLAQRRQDLLDYLNIDANGSVSERFHVVQGDIALQGLGISQDLTDRIARSTTHVVHSAGNVKLNQSLDDARKTAVDSARYLVEFVERCLQTGQFRKLEFVSTVGVAGRRTGLIAEDKFLEPRHPTDFHNTYEAAKWEAEHYLWKQIDAGLPATVHRPSMIVGDSRDGKIIHFQVFYHLIEFLIGRRTWGIVPETRGTKLDIIPVDYVARAIYLASTQELAKGEVWHLCSGPQHSWTLDQLTVRIRELLTRRGEPLPRIRKISIKNLHRLLPILVFLSPQRTKKFLKGLPFLLEYLEHEQLFDNRRTSQFLESHNLPLPAVDQYLEPVMSAFWDRPTRTKGR